MKAEYRLSQIKKEFDCFALNGSYFNRQTWTRIRVSAGIEHHARTCSYEQWQKICVAIAIYRQGGALYPATVEAFLKRRGFDFATLFPGFVSKTVLQPSNKVWMVSNLADGMLEVYNIEVSDRTIRRWCRNAGLPYSIDRHYTESDLFLLAQEWRQARQNLIESASRLNQVKQSISVAVA